MKDNPGVGPGVGKSEPVGVAELLAAARAKLTEGYQSSLAAATGRSFGVDATDVIGGAQAWIAAGLPVERAEPN